MTEPTPVTDHGAQVRPCRWSELLRVYAIHRACFPHPYPFWRVLVYQLGVGSAIFVADSEGELTGYVIITTTDQIRPPAPVAEVVSLAVTEAWRRRGLGRVLLQRAHAYAESRGLGTVYLEVAVGNKSAQALYAEAGYEVVRRLAHYYIDGEDAWLMRRQLSVPPEV